MVPIHGVSPPVVIKVYANESANLVIVESGQTYVIITRDYRYGCRGRGNGDGGLEQADKMLGS